jgi:hypothetical protein
VGGGDVSLCPLGKNGVKGFEKKWRRPQKRESKQRKDKGKREGKWGKDNWNFTKTRREECIKRKFLYTRDK